MNTQIELRRRGCSTLWLLNIIKRIATYSMIRPKYSIRTTASVIETLAFSSLLVSGLIEKSLASTKFTSDRLVWWKRLPFKFDLKKFDPVRSASTKSHSLTVHSLNDVPGNFKLEKLQSDSTHPWKLISNKNVLHLVKSTPTNLDSENRTSCNLQPSNVARLKLLWLNSHSVNLLSVKLLSVKSQFTNVHWEKVFDLRSACAFFKLWNFWSSKSLLVSRVMKSHSSRCTQTYFTSVLILNQQIWT